MEAVMKVGPKGQVVIPRDFRRTLKIYPGSRVPFKSTGNKLEIEKPPLDVVAIFGATAKGMGKFRFDSHETYKEELEERVN